MSLRKKGLKASGILVAGEIVNYGASFVRNMILARILTKADFGIAAAFAMIITLLEFSAKLGVARFVIQFKEGDRPEFISAAHLVQFGAGLLSALLLVTAAAPLALLFGLGEHRAALFSLALIPLIRGLEHMDVRRFERELRFGPSSLTEWIPQVLITLAAWPIARWLPDYRAVLVLLIAKAVFSCLASHWLAERPYRWQFERDYVSRMLRFGWPLVVNGFLMFGVLHGDQFLVATFYSMADLGPYAAAMSLTVAPTFFIGRVFSSVMLPVMAKLQDDPVAFERRYRFIIAVLCAFSACYAVGVIIGAEAMMQVVFGKKYAGAGVILACLSVANSLRNVRIASTIAAMAKGDSENQMISNFWRVVGLIPAVMVAVAGKPVWMVAMVGLLGETLACVASFRRLGRRDAIPWKASWIPVLLLALAIAVAGGGTYFMGVHEMHPVLALILAAAGGCLGGGFVIVMLEASREEAFRFWASARSGGWKNWLPRRRTQAAVKPTIA